MQPAFDNVNVVQFCACKRRYRVPFAHFAQLAVSEPSKNQVYPKGVEERSNCLQAINNNVVERIRPVFVCVKRWAVPANDKHFQPQPRKISKVSVLVHLLNKSHNTEDFWEFVPSTQNSKEETMWRTEILTSNLTNLRQCRLIRKIIALSQ